MADDAFRAGRSPIAANGEAVFVLIHVGVRADVGAKMEREHLCGDNQDGVGV